MIKKINKRDRLKRLQRNILIYQFATIKGGQISDCNKRINYIDVG